MESSVSVAADQDDAAGDPVHEIVWDAYASQYDLLAKHNPSYRENIERLRSLIEGFGLPSSPAICDLGAGTGNFICALAKDLPSATFFHLDADPTMNEVAAAKYASAGVSSVEIRCCTVTEAAYRPQSFDMVMCINSLYAMQHREEVLRRIRSWLKPGGIFFVIDFGRHTKMLDWAKYILGHVIRQEGLVGCAKFLMSSVESIRQNRRGSQGQADGTYWLHSPEEFSSTLRQAGFEVAQLETCYRGYCDLAVCVSPGQ
jgi:ubiquinone/menaquinone biosynthesis C-methylase UbiE